MCEVVTWVIGYGGGGVVWGGIGVCEVCECVVGGLEVCFWSLWGAGRLRVGCVCGVCVVCELCVCGVCVVCVCVRVCRRVCVCVCV